MKPFDRAARVRGILGGRVARLSVAWIMACALLVAATIVPAGAAERRPDGTAQTDTAQTASKQNAKKEPKISATIVSGLEAVEKPDGMAQAAKKKKKKKACPSAGAAKKKKKKTKKCPAAAPTAPVVTPPTTPPLPPIDFAPPLDQTIATSMDDSAAFLYEGGNPVQQGVAGGTIDDQRVAVLSGRVIQRNGAALPGATVAILDHPELGSTQTRAGGLYDIAVNGGGPLVVTYSKEGLLPAERRMDVPWQDYVPVADVALAALDGTATTIDSNGAGAQVARASVSTDDQGSRRTTMIFKAGTTAQIELENGSSQPLPGPWTVRATELTVGDAGPNAMPGNLPPTSGYTHATDFTIDQALAAGAVQTNFSNPVSAYVENYIGAPVGADVPAGTFDQEAGRWLAEPDGRVIKVVGITAGMADLNVDDDPAIDVGTELTDLGIDAGERTKLAELYTVGQELLRVPMGHFTPADWNWPWGPTAGAGPPPASTAPATPAPSLTCGSIVSCEDQTLRERLPVNGTPFSLYYSSARVPGHDAGDELDVKVTGATVPPQLKGIIVQASVAGRVFEQHYSLDGSGANGGLDSGIPIAPNLHWQIPWDGTDRFGRQVQGRVPVLVQTSFVYPAQRYETDEEEENSFGAAGAPESPGAPMSPFVALRGCVPPLVGPSGGISIGYSEDMFDSPWCGATIQRRDDRAAGMMDVRGTDELGGWSLDVHHTYDPSERTLHRGDGLTESSDLQPSVIAHVGGKASGTDFPAANGGSAKLARLDIIADQQVAPDGTIYVLSSPGGTGGLRRIEPDGTIFEVSDLPSFTNSLRAIAIDEDERVYVSGCITATADCYVVRVDPNGSVNPVAGVDWTGTPGPNALGDGGPATAAKLMDVKDLAMGFDGALYIADGGQAGVSYQARIRRVDPGTGLITSVAGGGSDPAPEDLGPGEPAVSHDLAGIQAVAFGPDGSIYLAMRFANTVLKVGTDGILKRFAGTGTPGTAQDGIAPSAVDLNFPSDLAVSPDGGTVYISTRHSGPGGSQLLLAVADERVSIVGGRTHAAACPTADGSSARDACFTGDHNLSVSPDGSLYARHTQFSIYKVAPRFEGFEAGGQVISSASGDEGWVFDAEGRHTRTIDTLTGTTLYSFSYDSEGRLVGVTDRDSRATVIVRDASGKATAIVAPGGASTELDVNAGGYATEIRDSAGAPTELTYDGGGLLTKLVDRRGGQHTFAYDGDGRLTDDDGPSGRSLSFARTGDDEDTTVTMTTGTDRQTVYRTRVLANGDIEQTKTSPSGAVTKLVSKSDGDRVVTDDDGTQTSIEYGPDPRFGLSVPMVSKQMTTTPGGRTSTSTFTRVAALSNPTDPFSFTTLTDTTNVDGQVDTLTYTKATRTFSEITAGNRRADDTLDSKDRFISRTAGLGRTPITYGYDASGRPSDEVQGTLHQTYDYDARDRLIATINAAGRGQTYGYDGADRLTSATDGVGGVHRFAYNAEGGMTGVTEPSGAVHALSRDGYEGLTGYTPAGGASTQTISRDAEGGATAQNLGAGHNVTATRDAGGRPSGYDATGDDININYSDATARPSEMNADRVGTANDQALAIEWDADQQTKLDFSGAAAGVFTLDYDGRDNLTSRRLVSGSTDVTTTFAYDTDDLRTREGPFNFTRGGALGELTRVDDGSSRQDFTYDGLGRQSTVTGSAPIGLTRFSEAYFYDAGGKLNRRDEAFGGATTRLDYTFDGAGRLTKVQRGGSDSEIYAYDIDGNRTSRAGLGVTGTETSTYDAQGRLATRGASNYSFDAAGFLTQRGADAFTYGPQGRLQGATVGGSPITYAYDALGRRTARTETGGTEQYLYGDSDSPWTLTASRDPSGELTQYFHDPYGRLVGFDRGGARFYVFTDDIGSPRLVTNAAGTTVKRIDYGAYGDVIADSAPAFSLRVGFAGGLQDPTSGLVQFGLRDYEPASGRWTSRDPILFDGGQNNLYAYVGNDPVNFVDLSGTSGRYWGQGAVEKVQQMSWEKTKDWAKQKTGLDKYQKFVDAKDKIVKTAETIQAGIDNGQVDQSGLAELECAVTLIGDSFPMLNWLFPAKLAVDFGKLGKEGVQAGYNKINRGYETAASYERP